MSTLEDLDDLEQAGRDGDSNMQDASDGQKDKTEQDQPKQQDDLIDDDILNSSTRDIITRRRLLENDTRIMRSEYQRLQHEKQAMHEKIKDNVDKIDNNR